MGVTDYDESFKKKTKRSSKSRRAKEVVMHTVVYVFLGRQKKWLMGLEQRRMSAAVRRMGLGGALVLFSSVWEWQLSTWLIDLFGWKNWKTIGRRGWQETSFWGWSRSKSPQAMGPNVRRVGPERSHLEDLQNGKILRDPHVMTLWDWWPKWLWANSAQ